MTEQHTKSNSSRQRI